MTLNNFDDDIGVDFEFGIIDKHTNGKVSKILFENDLDFDIISSMFNCSIDKSILSVQLKIIGRNFDFYTSYPKDGIIDIDINNINYFYNENIIFFKQHIMFILKNCHGISFWDDVDVDYELTVVDSNCEVFTMNKFDKLKLKQDGCYEVITNKTID
jgi:hypothetical protein